MKNKVGRTAMESRIFEALPNYFADCEICYCLHLKGTNFYYGLSTALWKKKES